MEPEFTLRLAAAGADHVTVAVAASAETPLTELAGRLRDTVHAPGDAPLYIEAGPLRLSGTLGDGQLRRGCLVGVGVPVVPPPATTGQLLAVISGLDAGAYIPLRRGVTAIGRDPSCQLPLRDPDSSRRHAIITCDGAGVWLADAGSTNGTFLIGDTAESKLRDTPVPLREGTPFRCGNTVLWLTDATVEPLPTYATAIGTRELLRPPRLAPPQPRAVIAYPVKPHHPDPPTTPWLGVALSVTLPLLLGGLLWWFMRDSMGVAGMGMLAFMALSPVLVLSQVLTDRWNRRRVKRKAVAEHAAGVAAADEKLAHARADELHRRRRDFADPFAVAQVATGPTTRLWERRTGDPDWLRLRIGLGSLPAELEIRGLDDNQTPGGTGAQHPQLPLLPTVVDLGKVGVLGLAGADRVHLSQWLLAQLAVLHSPRHLRLVLLTDSHRDEWSAAQWLPHLRGDHTPDGYGVAADPARRAATVTALSATVKRRAAQSDRGGFAPPDDRDEPTIVVVHDSTQRLTGLSGGSDVLDDGPAQRVFTVCLAADPRELPEQCGATVVLPSDLQLGANAAVRATIASSDVDRIDGVTPDLVGSWWFDRVARALAPLRERLTATDSKQLPREVGFNDVLEATLGKADTLDDAAEQLADRIVARWLTQPASTSAVIGADGRGPVGIDIAADGPHTLIAGTTGAGKSELLRTWLASLALGNRPDELNLMLIDYKGGSAFADCAALPHVVGLVTDLDTALTTRVLSSLRAELHRRERCLAAVGAADYEQYRREQHAETMARLVVVIDEFATLCAELPDLVTGLVDLARRGRSLGVHLVLATQRPAGVVSAEIRANTALRICLRVTDPHDSSDVLDSPDAAGIGAGQPGRALLRQQGTLTPVQIARVSQPLPMIPPEHDGAHEHLSVRPMSWQVPAIGAPQQPKDAMTTRGRAPTMLTRLVAAVQHAARSEQLGIDTPTPPWLPPLPSTVLLQELRQRNSADGTANDHAANDRGAAIALHDQPHLQTQHPYRIDLATGGHTAIVGGPRSGRTTALAAIAAGLALEYSPQRLRMFAVDNDGALADLAGLPHCDAVVAAGDAEHLQRLLLRLRGELTARRADRGRGVAAGGDSDTARPWLVLLLDSWETLRHGISDLRHGGLLAELLTLLRDGPGVGLRAVITGERQLLASGMSGLFSRRLILPMTDNDSYGLIGIAARDVPREMPPGRALLPENPVTQIQFALLHPDPAPSAQRTALTQLSSALTDILTDTAPTESAGALRVDALPTTVSPEQMSQDQIPRGEPWLLPVGVGGDRLETVALDLRHTTTAVIAGPPGSGKTTALRALGYAATARRAQVIEAVYTGGTGCGLPNAPVARGADELAKLVAELTEPGLILLDDAELVADMDPALDQAVAQLIADGEHRVVLAGGTDELLSLYRGCTTAARRARTGLLLAARLRDGELLGQPRLAAEGVLHGAGRGLLVQRSGTITLQLVQH